MELLALDRCLLERNIWDTTLDRSGMTQTATHSYILSPCVQTQGWPVNPGI